MPSLQFFIDNVCANFTEQSLWDLVKARLDRQPGAIADITRAIIEKDRSLDNKSARVLAEAAVRALAESGTVAAKGGHVYLAGRVPG